MPPKVVEEDRTVEIYLKAAQIFHEKGFDATSMSDLAEAVQLTKAGLYYYIKSKQELLFAIMDYGMDSLEKEVIAPARAESDPQARLQLIIEAHARNLTKGVNAIAILTDEVAALARKHRTRILERKRAYFDLVRETLVALKDAGKLQDVDPTVATFCLFGMLLWLPRWYKPEGRLGRTEVIGHLTKVAMGGLLKA